MVFFYCFKLDENREERGRGNVSFPMVEESKPKGFEAQPRRYRRSEQGTNPTSGVE